MYTKSLSGEIIFFYPHASLFDDVKHQSAFMCKNIVSKDGEDLSERFMITDDEQDMFEVCLREALPDVYEVLKPLTHGIENAFDGNAVYLPVVKQENASAGSTIPAGWFLEITGLTTEYDYGLDLAKGEVVKLSEQPVEGVVEIGKTYYSIPGTKVVVIRTVDHGAYNPNDITQVDATIQSAIEMGALGQFYSRVVNKGLTELSVAQFQANLADLLRRMKGLRRRSVL